MSGSFGVLEPRIRQKLHFKGKMDQKKDCKTGGKNQKDKWYFTRVQGGVSPGGGGPRGREGVCDELGGNWGGGGHFFSEPKRPSSLAIEELTRTFFLQNSMIFSYSNSVLTNCGFYEII